MNAITYELSTSKSVYYRQVYAVLDWLRDIGGLYGALSGICIALVFAFQFRSSNMFLMTELFSAPLEDRVDKRKEKLQKKQKSGLGRELRRQETVRSLHP